MCCGSRRAAWRAASARPVAAAPGGAPVETAAPVGAATPRPAGMKLRYGGTGAVRLRGPITGRAYEFSAVQPVQAVDFRDAAILARTSMFLPVPP